MYALPTPYRAMHVGYYVVRLVALRALDRRRDPAERRRTRRHELARAADRLGGAFAKAGQFAALMVSDADPDIADRLRSLLDDGPTLPRRRVERLTRRHSRLLGDELVTLDAAALGSGTVCSVYRAELRDRGVVAVKVLRPRAARRLRGDLLLLSPLRLLGRGPRMFHRTLYEAIRAECDLRLEATKQFRAHEFFTRSSDACVPAIAVSDSSRRILIMELIEGTPGHIVPDLTAPETVAGLRALVGAWASMAIATGWFHADPHPGNVLVERSGRCCLLDWGQAWPIKPELARTILADFGDIPVDDSAPRVSLVGVRMSLSEGRDHVFETDASEPDQTVTVLLFIKALVQLSAWASIAVPEVPLQSVPEQDISSTDGLKDRTTPARQLLGDH